MESFFVLLMQMCKYLKPWLKGLVKHCDDHCGIITGITFTQGNSLFAKLQAVDWLNALSLIKLASDVGRPVTAMGNNMLVAKKAYLDVGGYETIPFSVTEDFELFRQITKKGWKAKQLYNVDVLAKTQAIGSLKGLVQQRKRWMKGAMRVPWYIWILLVLQVLFYPIVFGLLFVWPWLGAGIWGSKLFLQLLWMQFYLKKVKQIRLIPYVIIYEFYFSTHFNQFSSLLLYVW